MATSVENPPQPASDSTLSEAQQIALQMARLRMAHEAAMLADAQAVLRQNREAVAAHQGLMVGATESEGSDVIHIGDVHYPAPPQPAAFTPIGPVAQPTPTAAPVVAAASTVGRWLLAAGIGGPLLGTAIALAPLIFGGTQEPSHGTHTAPTDPGTTAVPAAPKPQLYYDLKLGKPDQ